MKIVYSNLGRPDETARPLSAVLRRTISSCGIAAGMTCSVPPGSDERAEHCRVVIGADSPD
jgi:hypothetical protein